MNDFKFSESSLKKLGTCHQKLQDLMHLTLELAEIDFRIDCGHRSLEDQNTAVNNGASTLKVGKHNLTPSLAVDIYPVNNTPENQRHLLTWVNTAANTLNIKVRFGYFWLVPFDPPHVELDF